MKKVISVFIPLLLWQIGICQDFPPPTSVNITVDNDSVYISWQAPESKSLSQYNIYFNSCWEGGTIFQVGATTDTNYSQALPVFHYRMNFGISAEYLNPVGQSDTIWEYLVNPLVWQWYVFIQFEQPSDFRSGLASCVVEGNDNWELIDTINPTWGHCAAFYSESVESKAQLYSAPITGDEYYWPMISFWAKVPQKQGFSDTLLVYWQDTTYEIYAINDWQYFEYINNPGSGIYGIWLEAKGGGGGGIFVDNITVIDAYTKIENNLDIDAVLEIFPNPASSFITIQTKEGIPVEQVIIYSHLGQKVLEAKPVNNMVDVSMLKPGIYFLEVGTKDWSEMTKLVKQ